MKIGPESRNEASGSVSEAGPSNLRANNIVPPSSTGVNSNDEISPLPKSDKIESGESSVSPKAMQDRISAQMEKASELPSYADLLKSGTVQVPGANESIGYLNVSRQLASLCSQAAIRQYREQSGRGIILAVDTVVKQCGKVCDILDIIIVKVTDLKLSDDTYWNPSLFQRDSDSPDRRMVNRSYLRLWTKLAKKLTYPDFNKLPDDAKAAKINVPNGEFHLLLFKLIDPDYSYHLGRKISRFVDKIFGTSPTKECVSGLCSLSPEAMQAIRLADMEQTQSIRKVTWFKQKFGKRRSDGRAQSASNSAAEDHLLQLPKELAGPSLFQTLPAKLLMNANVNNIKPNRLQLHLHTIPPELLIQIVNEVGKLSEKDQPGSKDADGVDKKALLNFGLTCRRHLSLVLPELHHDAKLEFPLAQRHVTRTRDIRKAGYYTKRLILVNNDDPWRVHRPGDILHLFPNITSLRLGISSINAGRELQIINLALNIFGSLKELSLEGRVKLVHLPQSDKPGLKIHAARLQKLRLFFNGVGSELFIAGLFEMLQDSCRRLRVLEYRPFSYIEGDRDKFNWGYLGGLLQSETLQEVKLHMPAGYFEGCMDFLRSLAGQRRDLEIVDLNFEESRLELFSYGDALTQEILSYPSLTRIRVTHVHPVGREPITVVERVVCADRLERIFRAFSMELIRLRQIEWYESGYLGEEWKWHREEGRLWDRARLVRRLDAV
ncbi:hypothetical protein Dda_8744 [Drechslerella dactyloides]|uniref:Uncharacterized protein n=1 Tax=Drechslerella dactyloides TaxID=74499 RepID=A0AAD6IQY4_DREDA|nr:hypothetical protein Dda_8744 [Drechslerella dactyloides]